MGNVFPVVQGGALGRRAALRARLESLVSKERHFARTVPISDTIDAALPFHGLPLGCVHEVQSRGLACGTAFSALLAGRMPAMGGQLVYVASDSSFYPLGLLPYGIAPERWIHVAPRNSLDLAWTILEALRCQRVSAVLAVVKAADLTLCRRWQLAAEGSGATGFLLTDSEVNPALASVITRWRIDSIPASVNAPFDEPGWNIDLTYCRGGRPARWGMAWRNGGLEPFAPAGGALVPRQPQREVRVAAKVAV
jgi:protein ImuA